MQSRAKRSSDLGLTWRPVALNARDLDPQISLLGGRMFASLQQLVGCPLELGPPARPRSPRDGLALNSLEFGSAESDDV